VRQMFAPRVLQLKPTTLVPTVMVDCEVGLWSTFSVCNRNCNTGTKQRFRSVVQTPMNNGAYCPQLSDGYACAEEPCKCRNINLPKFDGALLLQASGTEPTLLMWFKTKVVQIALTQTNLHNPGDLIEWRPGIVGEEFFLAPPFKGLAAPFDGGMGSPIPKGPPVGSSEEVFLTAYGSWAGWRRSDFETTFPTRKLKGAMWWKKIPQVCRDSVDGAVMNGWNEWSSSECVLLWCGNSWLRMNTINFEIVEGPFESKKKPWSYSVPAPFNSRIDAAFTMPDSMEAYLFSGIWGVRWDPTEDTILEGPFLLTNHTLFHKVSEALGICPPDL